MCGRYESWVEDDGIEEILETEKRGSASRYLRQREVFPGTVQPVLYGSRVQIRAHLSRWGIPLRPDRGGRKTEGFADEELTLTLPRKERGAQGSRSLINARSESAADKTRFAAAFREAENGDGPMRRAVVVTSAYYEWKDGVKFRISEGDGDLLFLAALEEDDGAVLRENAPVPSESYSVFSSAAAQVNGEEQTSVGHPGRGHVILTSASSGEVARIHDRMPLFLRRDECEDWLYDVGFARRRLQAAWDRRMVVAQA